MRKYVPKTVVITGGSGGIGLLLLKKFIARGDTVYMLARSNPESFDNFLACDVGDEIAVKSAFSKIAAETEKIDILINNAGIGIAGATEHLDAADVRKCIDVNVMGVFYCCKYALPHMRRGGKIVNMSSVIAYFPRPFHTIYSASKAAVSSMSNGLRMELSHTGIQVCSIAPTGLATPFSKNRIVETQTSERYGGRIKTAHGSVENRKRMSPERAAAQMFRKINRRKLKPVYIIGGGFKVLTFMARFLPLNFMLKLTNKLFGGRK